MFTLETFFVLSMQQRYAISGLEVTTLARHAYRYLDERKKLITVAQPVLIFSFGNAAVEKAMPMAVKGEWITGSAGIAMQRIYAECAWGSKDIEAYICQTVADLRDNQLVKGISDEVRRHRA